MGDTTERVRTDIIVNDAQANAAFGRMVAGTQRMGGAFGGVVARAAALGTGILGAVGIARTVAGLDRGYQAVARIKAITGITAKEAHSLGDAFENSGVEAASAERIIMSMARKSALLGAGTKEASSLSKAYKKLGIDIAAGPSAKLLQMSKAAVSGKLGVVGLTTMMGTSKREAADFLTMLKKGPVELKKMMDSQLTSADLIDDKALASWQKMQQAKRNLSDAWGSVAGAFYKTIVPVATKFLEAFGSRLETWAPAAQRFGTYIVSHMSEAVTLAKVLAVTIAGIKLSGGMDGIKGMASGALGLFRGSGARAAAGAVSAVGGAGGGSAAISSARALLNPDGIAAVMSRSQRDAKFAAMARAVAVSRSAATSDFGFGAAMPGSFVGRGGGMLSRVAGGASAVAGGGGRMFMGLLRGLGSLAKLGGIGILIGGVAVGLLAIVKNTGGIRDAFASVLKSLGSGLAGVGRALSPLWGVFKSLAGVVGKALVGALGAFLHGLNALMPVFKIIGETIGWLASKASALGSMLFGGPSVSDIAIKWLRDHEDPTHKKGRLLGAETTRQALATRTAAGKYGQSAQDFARGVMDAAKAKHELNIMPGAHVTVYQDFAPGFDADKIKLAMLSDISKTGERRLSSGIQPLFTSGR